MKGSGGACGGLAGGLAWGGRKNRPKSWDPHKKDPGGGGDIFPTAYSAELAAAELAANPTPEAREASRPPAATAAATAAGTMFVAAAAGDGGSGGGNSGSGGGPWSGERGLQFPMGLPSSRGPVSEKGLRAAEEGLSFSGPAAERATVAATAPS